MTETTEAEIQPIIDWLDAAAPQDQVPERVLQLAPQIQEAAVYGYLSPGHAAFEAFKALPALEQVMCWHVLHRNWNARSIEAAKRIHAALAPTIFRIFGVPPDHAGTRFPCLQPRVRGNA